MNAPVDVKKTAPVPATTTAGDPFRALRAEMDRVLDRFAGSSHGFWPR